MIQKTREQPDSKPSSSTATRGAKPRAAGAVVAGEAEHYRAVVEDLTEVICRFKADGTFTFVNEVYCRFFGKSRRQLVGRKWQPRAMAEDRSMIAAKLRTLSPGNPVVVIENRVYSARGEVRWMQFVNRAFFDAAGRLTEIQAVGRDITERKRLEKERAEAIARLAAVQEEERRRIARELHDRPTQGLVALALELKLVEKGLAAGRVQNGRVKNLRRAVDSLQDQLREIAWDLRAGEAPAGGLKQALPAYLEAWSEQTQVPVDFECLRWSRRALPALVESTLYRVAQQALANVQHHARAGKVSVLLERDETMVRLTIEDDGVGFEVEAAQKRPVTPPRLGLLGMRERVALIGGTLLVESSPTAGTTIQARIPVMSKGKAT